MLGFCAISDAAVSDFCQTLANAGRPVVVPAGAPGAAGRRHRWEIEYKGRTIEARSAEEAHEILLELARQEEAKARAEGERAELTAKRRVVRVREGPKPTVTLDGIEITDDRFHKQAVIDYLMAGERLRFLTEWAERRAQEDDEMAAAMLLLH